MPHGNSGSHPRGGKELYGGGGAESQLDPLRHVGNADALALRGKGIAGEAVIHAHHLVLRHAGAVIGHLKNKEILFQPAADNNTPGAFHTGKTVHNGIFHKGLQQKLHGFYIQHRVFHIIDNLQMGAVPCLLNREIAPGDIQLLTDADDVIFCVVGSAQQRAEVGDKPNGGVIRLYLPYNTEIDELKGVKKKMGVDLRLQCSNLRVPQKPRLFRQLFSISLFAKETLAMVSVM